jgi:DNA-binding NtrC family response regulator
MRTLIVDDEARIRKTTRLAIESAGHSAAEAPTGPRALKAIEEESFEVVFLDLKLGNDDGLVWLEKLLKAQPALHVVMFTADANIATAVEAMRRGRRSRSRSRRRTRRRTSSSSAPAAPARVSSRARSTSAARSVTERSSR